MAGLLVKEAKLPSLGLYRFGGVEMKWRMVKIELPY